MPPQEIRAVLAADDPLVVRRLLELHRERLEEWLEEQRRLVASIERSCADGPAVLTATPREPGRPQRGRSTMTARRPATARSICSSVGILSPTTSSPIDSFAFERTICRSSCLVDQRHLVRILDQLRSHRPRDAVVNDLDLRTTPEVHPPRPGGEDDRRARRARGTRPAPCTAAPTSVR